MKRLTRHFFEGLLFLIPIGASLYIVYFLFIKIDSLLKVPLAQYGLDIPGVGFAITIVIIVCIGFLTSNFLTKRLFGLFSKIFEKLPLVKLIYSSIKDLIGAFVGDKKSFDKPVVVMLDKPTGTMVMGFITKDDMSFFGLKEHVAVYLPQSYNFAGQLFIFPRDHVQPIDADSSEVMTFLVSGGVSGGLMEEHIKKSNLQGNTKAKESEASQ